MYRAAGATLALLTAVTATAQTPTLLKDINPDGGHSTLLGAVSGANIVYIPGERWGKGQGAVAHGRNTRRHVLPEGHRAGPGIFVVECSA